MFTSLHALAQTATLLVVVTAEDAVQLRVNVTPTRTDDKTKAHKLRPLSLVGTPDELDEGFADALAEWQAPRRSLVEQARDAGGDEETGGTANKAAKASTATAEKKAESAPAAVKGKPGRKPKATADAALAGAAGGDAAGAHAGGGDVAGADAAGGDAAGADAAPEAAASGAAPGAGAAGDPAADEFTLDLF